MSGLVISNLSIKLGQRAILHEIGFAASQGTVTGLIGPNGAGKSTLLRAILGLIPVVSGTVAFDGVSVLTTPSRLRAQTAALVEQASATDARLTVIEVALLGRIPFQTVWQATPSPADRDLAEKALKDVGMSAFADRLYHTLSGGEQQRVQIARALAQQPKLLLLDEPTSHLDIHAQLTTLTLLRRQAAWGATVILALHDLNLAASFCDTLVVIQDGAQVASGAPGDVLTPALIRAVYEVDATLVTHPITGRLLIAYDLPETQTNID